MMVAPALRAQVAASAAWAAIETVIHHAQILYFAELSAPVAAAIADAPVRQIPRAILGGMRGGDGLKGQRGRGDGGEKCSAVHMRSLHTHRARPTGRQMAGLETEGGEHEGRRGQDEEQAFCHGSRNSAFVPSRP